MTITARVAAVAALGLLGALLLFIGIGNGRGAVDTAHSATVQTRTYYIAADEVNWNYAPQGKNMITGEPFAGEDLTFTEPGADRIGTTYKKSLYQEYTGASFTTVKPKDARWAHTGFLGPMIRAEVGDTIKIVFKNNLDHPASIHMHGVLYDKKSEGAPYSDGTSGKDNKTDDGVPPGATYTYSYQVPPRAGPGPHDGNSVMWMYHSHTDEISDTYDGLVGPMIIYSDGSLRPDGSVVGIDREFVAFYSVMNENASHYIGDNIAKYTTTTARNAAALEEDGDFQESNLMHSINGYVFGNGPAGTDENHPAFEAKLGERVRWYTMSLGTEVDLHTPHWHGNTVTSMGMRTDVLQILGGGMQTADMVPDDGGIWLLHCHINDHIAAGMSTRYKVIQ